MESRYLAYGPAASPIANDAALLGQCSFSKNGMQENSGAARSATSNAIPMSPWKRLFNRFGGIPGLAAARFASTFARSNQANSPVNLCTRNNAYARPANPQ